MDLESLRDIFEYARLVLFIGFPIFSAWILWSYLTRGRIFQYLELRFEQRAFRVSSPSSRTHRMGGTFGALTAFPISILAVVYVAPLLTLFAQSSRFGQDFLYSVGSLLLCGGFFEIYATYKIITLHFRANADRTEKYDWFFSLLTTGMIVNIIIHYDRTRILERKMAFYGGPVDVKLLIVTALAVLLANVAAELLSASRDTDLKEKVLVSILAGAILLASLMGWPIGGNVAFAPLLIISLLPLSWRRIISTSNSRVIAKCLVLAYVAVYMGMLFAAIVASMGISLEDPVQIAPEMATMAKQLTMCGMIATSIFLGAAGWLNIYSSENVLGRESQIVAPWQRVVYRTLKQALVPVLLVETLFGGGWLIGYFFLRYHFGQKVAANPIVYFRSFSYSDAGSAFGSILAPIASRLGVVVAFAHRQQLPSVLHTSTQAGERAELHAIDDAQWQQRILQLLETAVLVVVDRTVQTEGLEWEIAQARRVLGPERVIVLARHDTQRLQPAQLDDATIVYKLNDAGSVRTAKQQLRRLLEKILLRSDRVR